MIPWLLLFAGILALFVIALGELLTACGIEIKIITGRSSDED